MHTGICWGHWWGLLLPSEQQQPKNKIIFFMGLWDFTSSPPAEKQFQSCANRLFQVSPRESKPSDEDVALSSSSQKFLQRVSIPVWVGQVWSGFTLRRGEVSEDQRSWQRSGKPWASTFQPAAGGSPEVHRLHPFHGRIFMAMRSAAVSGLSGQQRSVAVFLTPPTPQQIIRPLTCVIQLAVVTGG